MSIVINLVDQIEGYYKSDILNDGLTKSEYKYLLKNNMTSYNYNKLKQITENSKIFIDDYLSENNVDCFMIHMLQIYNKYIFDVDSMTLSNDDDMRELPPDLYP